MNNIPDYSMLKKSSRQAAIVTAIGALLVFGALAYSAWQLHKLEQQHTALEQQIGSKRAELDALERQISVLRDQKRDILSDYKKDIGQSKQWPIEVAVKPRADARHTGSFFSSGQRQIHYSIWLDIPDDRRDEIESVEYFFNHPSFTEPRMAGDPVTPGFRIEYIGWGCMRQLIITLTLKTGEKKQMDFDMCASIWDEG
jgi:cell division protein FtsB